MPYIQHRFGIKSGAGIKKVNTPHKSQKHSRPGYACNLRLAATLWFQTRDSGQTAPQESATSGHLMVSSSANISLLSQMLRRAAKKRQAKGVARGRGAAT
jgi:hypothetical protein